MAREVKELMLVELEKKFQNVKQTGCIVVGYQGLTADEARRLRAEVRAKGAELTVVKNALFALAMEHLGSVDVGGLLQGPSAVVSGTSPVDAAKTAKEAAKSHQAIQIRGAYVEGKVLQAADVDRLADIPSREVLLSRLAGAMIAPVHRLLYGLLAKPRALMSGIEQLRKKREQEGTA